MRVCAGWLAKAQERDHMAGLSRALLPLLPTAALSTGAGGMPGNAGAAAAPSSLRSGAKTSAAPSRAVPWPGQGEGKGLFGLSGNCCCRRILVSSDGVDSLPWPEACPVAVCH